MSEIDLSIIIPTYNRLLLLKEALDSFVGLLDCSYEVVIVDDGSTDGTAEYLRSLHEPIRAFFQEHKGGNAARNYGLREARGRYIKFLDDDDWLIVSTVDQQVQYLNIRHEVDVCYSGYGIVYDDGSVQFIGIGPNSGFENRIVERVTSKWVIPPFIYILRTEAARKIDWDETLSSSQDTDYFLRIMLEDVQFDRLPGIVGWFRHDSQRERISSARAPEKVVEKLTNTLRILHKAENALEGRKELSSITKHTLAQRYLSIGMHLYLLNGDKPLFHNIMKRALELDPSLRPKGRFFPLAVRLIGYERAIKLRQRSLWRTALRKVDSLRAGK